MHAVYIVKFDKTNKSNNTMYIIKNINSYVFWLGLKSHESTTWSKWSCDFHLGTFWTSRINIFCISNHYITFCSI